MIAWAGTTSNIVGAFLVAFGITLAGYGAFLFGSVAWLMIAVRRGDNALALLNFAFLCANMVGLYRGI